MSLSDVISSIRHLDPEKIRGLRPRFPPVAVEINRQEMNLVRLKRRRGRLTLEAHVTRPLPEASVGVSIFRPNLGSPDAIVEKVKELLAASGTRPGMVSLILPDNLAKVTLMTLPEMPASKKQLAELIRFKLRRSVPFRLEDAVISYQMLSGEGRAVTLLVALMLRSVVEQYERVFEAAGARPGLVDLCTPNLFNLCRADLRKAAQGSRDVALLNCAQTYFSLLILRGERLVFYRCKSYAVGDEQLHGPNGVMTREMTTSLSYYQDKLGGEGLHSIYVRSMAKPLDQMIEFLQKFSLDEVVPVDPSSSLALPEGLRLDPEVGQRIAPAVGSAAGRG